MLDLKKFTDGFARDERGASLVEYTVLIALVTVGTIAIINTVGGKVLAKWTSLSGFL